MLLAYSSYCNSEILKQLYHPWPTHKNKVMNNSINAYAGKSKTYLFYTSLDIRVIIAVTTQVLEYHQL